MTDLTAPPNVSSLLTSGGAALPSGLQPTTGPGEFEFVFDDYTQRIVVSCLFALISIVGTFGNSLVIAAVLVSRKLRTATNVFVVSLSFADLLTCLFLPWNVVALLSTEGWPTADEICATAAVVMFTCVGCSVYTLAAIAINRYVLITQPMSTYRAYYTKWKMALMIAITWAIPFFTAMMPVMFGLGELGYDTRYSTCTHKTSHPLSDYYSLTQAILIYPIPMVTIVLCYCFLFLHIRRHARNINEQPETSSSSSSKPIRRDSTSAKRGISKRQVEISKNLFYVVCAFALCITPYCASLVIPYSEPFVPWAGAVILFNSCVNPLIYSTKHPYFRQVMGAILKCRPDAIPEPSDWLRSQRGSNWTPR